MRTNEEELSAQRPAEDMRDLPFVLGVYPAPVLEATAGSVERILESVQTAAGLDLTAFWPW